MSGPYSPARLVGTFEAHYDLTPRERAELQRHGVADKAIDRPTPLRAGHVLFDGPGRFDFETAHGLEVRSERAFLILVEDEGGDPADIVAWQPARDRVGSWRGVAWGIGQGDIYAPRMDEHDGLPVHRDPLSWLRADRRGIVIIRPRLAAAWLDDAGPLVAEDRAHAVELDRALTRRAPRILVPASDERRAA